MSNRDFEILWDMAGSGPSEPVEVAMGTGLSERTVRRYLNRLEREGMVRRLPADKRKPLRFEVALTVQEIAWLPFGGSLGRDNDFLCPVSCREHPRGLRDRV